MNIDIFFYENPMFRLDEFIKWKATQGSTNPKAVHASLNHYINNNRLLTLRRGIYAVVPPNTKPENLIIDPYLLAAKAANDSVLAYHTALELHGIAYSTFSQFTFLTTQKIKPFTLQEQWYQPVAMPTKLKKLKQEDIEVTSVTRQGVLLRITSLERTYVDVLSRTEICGGWEEVYRSIDKIAVLNQEAVVDYTLKLNNRFLAAKVGFFLEQRQGAFAPTTEMLNKLQTLKPKSPQYLADHHHEKCKLIQRWNLMVPLSLLTQSWEEPANDV